MLITTVVIFGKMGRLVINEADLPAWRARGYRTEIEITVAEANTPAAKGKAADANKPDAKGKAAEANKPDAPKE